MTPRPIVDWIALNLLPGLGPILQRRALDRFGDPAEIAYKLPPDRLLSLSAFPRKSVRSILDARKTLRRRAEREWRRCEKLGIRVLTLSDPNYPAALTELPDAPQLLYMKGELPVAIPRVAIIGSRACTAYGKRVAAGLAMGLAARGVEVVSGGARGIDTTAHRGALEERGRTVAVLGSGLLQPYPAENASLFEQIAASGAVLSEFPLDEPPHAGNFPRRNRLISGLSAAVVVVEAARRSGTLSTASHALDQGREVLAVPGPVSSARSEGCNALIQQGAKLVQNIDDIVEELSPLYTGGLPKTGESGPSGPAPDLDGLAADEEAVVRVLDEIEAVHLDDLARKVPFGVGRLQAALFGLQLRHAVELSPGRYYLLRPKRQR